MTTPETKSANEPAEQQSNLAPKPSLLGGIRKAFLDWLGLNVTHEKKSSDELAEIRTDMAATRTLMAADRTLMAWVRTSLSMLSFGFTIYKILQAYQETGAALPQENTPRNIGLFLTGFGTLAMVMGTIEYWHTLKELRQLQEFRLARPSLIMALLMSVLGVLLFFSIIISLF